MRESLVKFTVGSALETGGIFAAVGEAARCGVSSVVDWPANDSGRFRLTAGAPPLGRQY